MSNNYDIFLGISNSSSNHTRKGNHKHEEGNEYSHTHEHEHGHEHTHKYKHEHDCKHNGENQCQTEQKGSHCTTGDFPYEKEKHGHTWQPKTIITVRATSGLSGDMILSGLASLANLSNKDLDLLVRELNVPALHGVIRMEKKSLHSIAGVGCSIALPKEHEHRNIYDITQIIETSSMPDRAKELSLKSFTMLAHAEAAVHGKELDKIHFHEVGALDSILDTCMACRIYSILSPDMFTCSPLPLADGTITCAHGKIPSPAPAVLHMLEGVAVCGFAGQGETVTPTALSLLKVLNANFGTWPSMTIEKTVISYGTKVFPHVSNGAIWALGKA